MPNIKPNEDNELFSEHKLIYRRDLKLLSFVLLSVLVLGYTGFKSVGSGIEAAGLQSIDLEASDFFWMLQPWRNGKLVTVDGWGRFAEISFKGAEMRITPLVDFPCMHLNKELITWPEAGLITGRTSDRLHHIAAIDGKKTKGHAPLFTWGDYSLPAVLLDPREGLVSYSYLVDGNNSRSTVTDVRLFIYNYKEDRMIYEGPETGFFINMILPINEKYLLSEQRSFDGSKKVHKKIFYDWRTGEIAENGLTDALNRNDINPIIGPNRNIHPSRRILFGESGLEHIGKCKVSWDKNYSNVTVTSLSYLIPENKKLNNFIISPDGCWVTASVEGYRGLRNENLYKRAFFHLDERYPNGISMAVITEDYEEYQWEVTAFVEHPVHGMCHAQEWQKGEAHYLRLYKMSDVLVEINRQMAE